MNQTSMLPLSTLRASTGTCMKLGLAPGRCDVFPTTAYLLLGERCRRTCAFCAQSSLSSCSAGMLSRISWPEVELDDFLDKLGEIDKASKQGRANGDRSQSLRRICVQVTDCDSAIDNLVTLVPQLKNAAHVPVSVSFKPRSLSDMRVLFGAGADRLGIAIDAADPLVYSQVKGGDYWQAREYLISAASEYPGRISTHVIVGLGESEESAIRLISEMIGFGITVGLFAFTPIRGTPLESRGQPNIGQYRRVQTAAYLLKVGAVSIDSLAFAGGSLVGIEGEPNQVVEVLMTGKAFETSGCDGCNRPYYNERPGSIMYNYPRPLSSKEAEAAITETGLWRIDRL